MAGFDLSYGTRFHLCRAEDRGRDPPLSAGRRHHQGQPQPEGTRRPHPHRASAADRTLGREPTLAELSEATALQPEDIAVAETATCATESLQRRSGEDGFALEDVLTEGEMEEKILERIALREAIAQLTDREQMVIRLRYFHGLTQDKTAKILGVSQVQISRIEKKALAALRQHI